MDHQSSGPQGSFLNGHKKGVVISDDVIKIEKVGKDKMENEEEEEEYDDNFGKESEGSNEK